MSEQSGKVGRWWGWAVFLGCSWTWVIGMFLPALLVRDWGGWGWLVFAVPNVIGAAAMGWVLRQGGQSEAIVRDHRAACIAFSLVTLAFHAFVAGWLVREVFGVAAALAAVVATVGLLAVGYNRPERDVWTAVGVLAISLACWAVASAMGLGVNGVDWSGWRGDVWYFLPVSVLGFALCPYLDLTFHRALQATGGGSDGRRAFTVGFGVVFLAMIVFSLWYADELIISVTGAWITESRKAAALVAVHVVAQIAFTSAVHLRAARAASRNLRQSGLWLVMGLAAVGAAGVLADYAPSYAGLSPGEIGYRGFMAFYGLLFPAYVWLCMVPTRDGHWGTGRGKGAVCATVVAIGLPMLWMGAVQREAEWLAAAAGVVVASRLLVWRPGRRARGGSGFAAEA